MTARRQGARHDNARNNQRDCGAGMSDAVDHNPAWQGSAMCGAVQVRQCREPRAVGQLVYHVDPRTTVEHPNGMGTDVFSELRGRQR